MKKLLILLFVLMTTSMSYSQVLKTRSGTENLTPCSTGADLKPDKKSKKGEFFVISIFRSMIEMLAV